MWDFLALFPFYVINFAENYWFYVFKMLRYKYYIKLMKMTEDILLYVNFLKEIKKHIKKIGTKTKTLRFVETANNIIRFLIF